MTAPLKDVGELPGREVTDRATLVPDDEGTAKPVADPSRLEMPSADKWTEETASRLREPGSAEIRHITADDVTPSESRAP